MNLKSLISLLIFSTLAVTAQTSNELVISPQVKEVLLYQQGAQVIYRESVQLKAGLNKLTFKDLPEGMEPSAVQLNADKDVMIMSVSHKLNFLDKFTEASRKLLEDSLQHFENQLKRTGAERQAFVEEQEMLRANRSIGGENTGVALNELQKMADFVRARHKEIGLKIMETDELMVKQRANADRFRRQLNQQKETASKASSEVNAVIKAGTTVKAVFELVLFVRNCGWVATYDVRAGDVSKPLSVMAKATVYQQTGQDWNEVKLTLSTGNPAIGGIKPDLQPWFVSAVSYSRYKSNQTKARYKTQEVFDKPLQLSEVTIVQGVKASGSRTVADIANVNTEISTNTLFEIALPYTIINAGEEKTLDIVQSDVPANFIYAAAPKLDKNAFLIAEIINWDKPEWLPGDANIYYEGNYVGKSFFDTRLTDDTLRLSLGRDNNIVIERKQLQDFSERTSFLGNNKKVSRAYEITVRNKRNVPVVLMLEDQIPVASNDQVSVSLDRSDNAQYDKSNGKLVWRMDVKPNQSEKIGFAFSVRYPKKLVVPGL
jgi:uncharacterized protein (TIGR02231 family)